MKVTAIKDTINHRTKPLNLSTKYAKFLGKLPSDWQWTMLIYGPSHGGKSSFALQFAQELANNGAVLYNNNEENLGGGTLQDKLRGLGIYHKNIAFYDDTDIDGLRELLASKKYRFCIMDSLSKLAKSNRVKGKTTTALSIFDWYKEYPHVSFVHVLFSTKDGDTYKGETDLLFLVDLAVEVKAGVASCMIKNRYKHPKKDMELSIFK